MSNIKKFQDFISEKKSTLSRKELSAKYNEFAKKAQTEINKKLAKDGKGKIMLIDLSDSDIIKDLSDDEKVEFKKISKQLDKLDGFNVDENLEFDDDDDYIDEFDDAEIDEDNELHLIAREIKDGNTNGEVMSDGKPLEWDLEVNIRDWVKLDREDICLIANYIRNGNLKGNDPIDWKIDFDGDSFDIEEEEELTRKDIAKDLDIDESDFDDSHDLGNMADNLINQASKAEYVQDEVDELFDAYLENNDISTFFTNVIDPSFKYNKIKTLYNDVLSYYPEFEKDYGYLEEIGSHEFNTLLRDKIRKFFAERNITEKKKNKK